MITESGQSKCKRCGRWFQPKSSDQEYGEKCMRKMAGQTMLQDRYVVPPRKKRRKKSNIPIYEECEIGALDHDDANSEFMTDEEKAAAQVM